MIDAWFCRVWLDGETKELTRYGSKFVDTRGEMVGVGDWGGWAEGKRKSYLPFARGVSISMSLASLLWRRHVTLRSKFTTNHKWHESKFQSKKMAVGHSRLSRKFNLVWWNSRFIRVQHITISVSSAVLHRDCSRVFRPSISLILTIWLF